ncbi:ribonuclease H-like domain-containing protein [Rhodocollybia butyracea]|uniref:Ribonuclease H-like domain-containing protein n=1 Tax=Rhodocollybia butyracea TaxID=206335 RepID=A0A9P5PLU9_9AGAR|nr:ribonuclease H-like domain-containing protein [Rhodocollybia butyracea]
MRTYRQYCLGPETDHTVFESELVGILLAIDIIRALPKRREACVLLDNQAAIQATKGDHVVASGRYLVEEIRKKLEKLMNEKGQEFRLTIQWVPGHVGVEGNKNADRLAKKASQGASTPLSDMASCL